jgi:peptide chain release factor subunit 1
MSNETNHEEGITTKSAYKLKKLIKQLKEIKGRHTELVTVYVPVGYSLIEIINQLKQEQSTAENIKSKNVRKNVTAALEKIMRHLALYKKTPEHGLALFAGNISEKEGAADIEVFAIEPPEPIKVKMYWCDQKFVLEPLEEMVEEKEIYGLVCLDRSEGDIALLKGRKIESLAHFESIVPGKSRAGGQSSARFARVRERLLNDFLKEVGEATNKAFDEHKEIRGIIVSGPGPTKEFFLREGFIRDDIQKKILGTVDTSYTGEHGLEETIVKGEHLIKEAHVIKEKKLMERFFSELQKPQGLALYKLDGVLKALEMGAVEMLIIIEDIELKIEGVDAIEFLEEKAQNYGTKITLVSRHTREGVQFRHLGGIGALLRYRIE